MVVVSFILREKVSGKCFDKCSFGVECFGDAVAS